VFNSSQQLTSKLITREPSKRASIAAPMSDHHQALS